MLFAYDIVLCSTSRSEDERKEENWRKVLEKIKN